MPTDKDKEPESGKAEPAEGDYPGRAEVRKKLADAGAESKGTVKKVLIPFGEKPGPDDKDLPMRPDDWMHKKRESDKTEG